MLIYNIVYIINFILALLSVVRKKYNFLFLSFLILNIFLCFNYMNGIDWTNYQKMYLEQPLLTDIFNKNIMLTISERDKSESLFFYIMVIFKTLKINYEFFQYFFTTIFLVSVYKIFKEYTKIPLIGIFIYYSSFLLGNLFEPIIRQLISMSIFYYSIESLEKKKKREFICKNFIGIFFHNSSALLLLLFFLPLKRVKLKNVLLIMLITLILTNYIEQILIFMAKYILFLEKYVTYFKISEYGNISNINYVFFIKILIGILLGWFTSKNKEYLDVLNNRNSSIILNLYWINEICFILQRKIGIFYRIQYYFDIFYAIILVWIFQILLKKYSKKSGFLFLISIAIIYYRMMFLTINNWYDKDPMKFLPYSNYISEILLNENIKKNQEKIDYRLNQRLNSN